MHSIMKRYLQILDIELDDLKEDIEIMIEKNEERGKEGRITQYVLLENLAVLRNELCGIGSFRKILKEFDPTCYSSIEDFINTIEVRFKKQIQDCGLVEGIYHIIERKLRKVLKYVTHE